MTTSRASVRPPTLGPSDDYLQIVPIRLHDESWLFVTAREHTQSEGSKRRKPATVEVWEINYLFSSRFAFKSLPQLLRIGEEQESDNECHRIGEY